jgi:hypothetical protein
MWHVYNLRQLDRHARSKLLRFERRARLLRAKLDDAGRLLDEHQLEAELSYLVINLQSYWSNWSRAFYLSGALGTISVSGVTVSSALGLTSERDAMTVAIRGTLIPSPPPVWPSHKEPKWFDASALSQAITSARTNTAGPTTVILNSAPLGLAHLRIVRNYCSHRSAPLKQDALALGPTYLVGRPRKLSDILLFVEPARSVSVIERWILDLGRLARALCA